VTGWTRAARAARAARRRGRHAHTAGGNPASFGYVHPLSAVPRDDVLWRDQSPGFKEGEHGSYRFQLLTAVGVEVSLVGQP
jgi:hypothetical protein